LKIALFSALTASAVAGAAMAQAPTPQRLSPGVIFTDAAIFPQIIVAALLAATVAAVVICVRKLMPGKKLAGGSAFISGLRAGGPLLGLLGATYGLLNSAIGIANVQPKNLLVVMPGIAEMLMIVLVGLLAGVVAVIAHWAIESRIDRQVLSA
jgi:hypothetical protein